MAIEIRKKENESTGSLLQRFTRVVRASNLVKTARGLRFKTEKPNRRQKRLSALHRTKMVKDYQKKFKLGRPVDTKQGRKR